MRSAFYERVLTGVWALPGVRAAGFISGLPMRRGGGIWPVGLNGDEQVRGSAQTASLRFVTPGYFGAMGIRLEDGRDVQTDDTLNRRAVAVVSESLVRRFWPNRDPIGRTFNFAGAERTVVGVVGDVRVRGLERDSEPQVYLPYRQVSDGSLPGYVPTALAVRTDGDPSALIAPIRALVHEANPTPPIAVVETTAQIVAEQTASRDAQLRVIAIFAVLAVVLAGTGIHGLLSFTVSHRTREFGVRLALGASPLGLIGMVAREGMALVLVGLVAGSAVAFGDAHAMQALLAGVTPDDAATFWTAVSCAAVLSVAGTLSPALRAARVDPAIAMRE